MGDTSIDCSELVLHFAAFERSEFDVWTHCKREGGRFILVTSMMDLVCYHTIVTCNSSQYGLQSRHALLFLCFQS